MHRLREWFGIKDWQGPQQNVQTNSQVKDETNKQTSTPSPTSATVESTTEKVTKLRDSVHDEKTRPDSATIPQTPSLLDKTELWFKQYIPHKTGTCFSCKLVTMTTVLAWTVFTASFTVTQYKKFHKDYRRLFFLMGFSATSLGLSYLSLTFYDEDPSEVFKSKKQKEKVDEK